MDRDHGAAPLVLGVDVPVGFRGVRERMCRTDDGNECSRVREPAEEDEALAHECWLRQPGEDDRCLRDRDVNSIQIRIVAVGTVVR